MKNKLNGLLVLALIIFVALGCSTITDRVQKSVSGDNSQTPQTSDSNKSVIDQTTENIVDGETTGVAECDDVIKIISDQSKNEDDNYLTKAAKDYFIGQIKKSLRQSMEENKNDKAKMAEQCKDFKVQLEKQLKEEQEKQK